MQAKLPRLNQSGRSLFYTPFEARPEAVAQRRRAGRRALRRRGIDEGVIAAAVPYAGSPIELAARSVVRRRDAGR